MASGTSDARDYTRAKQYKRARIAFFVGGIAFSWITSLVFLLTGSSRKSADAVGRPVKNRHAKNSLVITVFLLMSWLVSFPLAYLRGYRLEHQFEMSNQTRGQWLGEQVKALLLQLVLMVPLAQVMLEVIRRRPKDWWAVLSAMAIPFTVILAHLAPVLILPIFNTYQPLRDKELAARLRLLAERSGITIADIMEMDMSRQTNAANAFVAGIGSSKRIVLADTLLDELTHDEIETIVAHEIAHQVNADVWRLLAMGVVTTAFSTWLAQRSFNAIHSRSYSWTGIRGASSVEALPLLGLITSVVGLTLMPLQNAYSRHIERKADQFALELSDNPSAFKSALEKITETNLSDPDPTTLEVILLHSHPPVNERRVACDRYAAD
jgi:STE24 endopeptidase